MKDVRLEIRLTGEQREYLTSIATKRACSVAEVIRDLIEAARDVEDIHQLRAKLHKAHYPAGPAPAPIYPVPSPSMSAHHPIGQAAPAAPAPAAQPQPSRTSAAVPTCMILKPSQAKAIGRGDRGKGGALDGRGRGDDSGGEAAEGGEG